MLARNRPRLACRGAWAGFTLIELLVVLAIVGVLLTLAAPKYLRSIDTARETTLVENLRTVREAIDHYYGDTGQYPESLEQLVEKRYLRALPVDPVSESSQSWVIVPPPGGAPGRIYDLRSGAAGADRRGKPFAEL